MTALQTDPNKIVPLKTGKNQSKSSIILLWILIPIVVFVLSLAVGRYWIPPTTLIRIVGTKLNLIQFDYPATLNTVLFEVRLPRVIASFLVGMGLSAAGAVYQGLFRNPMASPDILGASAGAGFGAAMGILLSFSIAGIQITSFIFGLLAVGATYLISSRISSEGESILVMVLTGIVIGALFQAFIMLLKFVADPNNTLPVITFWLMGGLSAVTKSDLLTLALPILIGLIPLFLFRWQLNVLSFGEEEAKALGVNTRLLKVVIVVSATLITAASVALSGLIGWVGLIIPHMARMITGPDYRQMLPLSLILGGSYLALVDDLARTLFAAEIPLGILTAILGAPFFIYLLTKGKQGWR